ncbi:S41 family peptidase [Candidatus Soleaferrea massiliensis]|uniref:S41 family peptidase n=1 Tax=Candidatus Soleaferrea massiliensis TaxID=1470354 RepID=UPI00058F461B|nr:S41 family peptidase [Candidatus Soleaferrea massiliensis]
MKKGKVFGIILLILLLLAGGVFAAYKLMDPHNGTIRSAEPSRPVEDVLTFEQAREDLDRMVQLIAEKHYATIDGLPSALQSQYDREIGELQSMQAITVLDVWGAADRIANKLNDAHTVLGYSYGSDENMKYADMDLTVADDGSAQIEIEGISYPVTAVNGVPIETLFNKASGMLSYENKYRLAEQFETHLHLPEFLAVLGADYKKDRITVAYKNTGGQVQDAVFLCKSSADPVEVREPIRYTIDEQTNTALLTIDSCQYDEYYRSTLREFFTQVKEKKIAHVILDLRENGGGNSQCANEFLRYLDIDSYKDYGSRTRYSFLHFSTDPGITANKRAAELTFQGKLYLLTSRKTFSSAVMFAALLYDNQLATVIGEPAGNAPSCYGDVLTYQLPNSKLTFSTTYKYFIRPDAQNTADTILPGYVTSSEEALDKAYELIGD